MHNTQFIFVIGAPRSGTTWLHKMIAEHPAVYSLNGSNTFLQGYIFPLLDKYEREKIIFTDKGFTRGIPSKLNRGEWEIIISDYVKRFYQIIPHDSKFYVEKATDLTSEIHKIKKYIPNSKFVHIIRDGRNETLSEMKLRKKYGAPFGIEDVYRGAHRWKKQITEARENSEGFKKDYLEIYYEQLFEDTEYYLNKIFLFCGLADENKISKEIGEKYSYKNNTVSMPTSKVANDEGKLINPFEKEMSKIEQALFDYIAGDLLINLGYRSNLTKDKKLLILFIQYLYLPFYKFKKIFSKALSLFKKYFKST